MAAINSLSRKSRAAKLSSRYNGSTVHAAVEKFQAKRKLEVKKFKKHLQFRHSTVQSTPLYASSYLLLILQKSSNRIWKFPPAFRKKSSTENYLLWEVVKDGQKKACGFDLRSNSEKFSANKYKQINEIMKMYSRSPGKRFTKNNTKTLSESFMPFLGLVGYFTLFKTEGVEVGFCLFLLCLDISIDTVQNMK